MKRVRPRVALSTTLLLVALACAPESHGRLRVSVVGIDGATWRVIDPLFARGELPNLARLVDDGVRARLVSRRPLISPAVWTTIATGVSRLEHRILDFRGPGGLLVSSRDRRAPALWTLASRSGLRSAVIGWWATYPAESIDGVIVSDRALKTRQKSMRRVTGRASLRGTEVRRLVHPPDAFEAFHELLSAPVPGGDDLEDFDVVATMRLEDATIARSLLALRGSHGPFDLELLLLRGVDPVSHHFWQYHEPDASAYEDADRPRADEVAQLGATVEDHYRYVDGLLGELRDDGPDRVVLVLSDHGFEAGYQGFRAGAVLMGTHTSEEAARGILVAAGGPFRRGIALGEVSIFDVAPTLLRLLDLPVAETLTGHVLEEALDPGWLGARPAQSVARYQGAPSDLSDPSGDPRSPAGEAMLLELRSLGYLE